MNLHLMSDINLQLLPLFFGLLCILSVALVTDLTKHKIPNKLILVGLVVSLILQVMLFEYVGLLYWLKGVALGFFGFLPLYILRAMAAGDVKLMMAVGGFLGYPLIITALIYTIISGGIFAVIYTLLKGRFGVLTRNMKLMAWSLFIKASTKVSMGDVVDEHSSAGKMPYAVAIATGTLVAVYIGGHGKLF